MNRSGSGTLPILAELTPAQRVFAALSIASALLLLLAFAGRVAAHVDPDPWALAAFAGGLVCADFVSGLVHWAADTWGRDDLPLVGRRLLVPFRVHHVNPDDFVGRSFIATNGDVAFIAAPVLAGLFTIPLDTAWGGPAAVFGLSFCGLGMLTNQVHQWAHAEGPPAVVRVLQTCGFLLRPAEHAAHHQRPFRSGYCIATGWCNGPLDALGFFRHLEAAITRVTGARPRADDQRYLALYAPGAQAGQHE